MALEPSFLLLLILGISISTLVSMIGLGGGILFIPLFILGFGLPPELAVGTSIACMLFTNISATIGFWRKKKVNLKLALAFDIFDIPGIILGAWISEIAPAQILSICCGAAICALAVSILLKKEKEQNQKTETVDNKITETGEPSLNLWKGKNLFYVIISSFLGGLITGMVGVGGGTVDTTSMILIGVPVQMAAGSTQLAMLFTNAFGATVHGFLGNIYWIFVIPIGIGALIGAQIGSRAASRMNNTILRKILISVALFTGIRLILTPFFPLT